MRSCAAQMGLVRPRSLATGSAREGLNPRGNPRTQPTGQSLRDGPSQRRLIMFDAFAYASALGRIRHVTALLISA